MNSSFIMVVEFPTAFFNKIVLVKILDGTERKSFPLKKKLLLVLSKALILSRIRVLAHLQYQNNENAYRTF